MNKVAAVVVTYNRIELLQQCVEALLKQKYPCDILLVNNNSVDGTEEWALELVNKFDNIKYQNTGANLGGAGGFNYGMRYAAEAGYEFVWVMDDDCMPKANSLEVFLDYEREHSGEYGFLSSKVLWKDQSVCVMNVPRAGVYSNNKDFDSKTVKISMASFVSLFVPARIIKNVGLPIKEFFIWTDDWEFTRRISLKYPCYLLNESVVIHKSKSNIGANIATDSIDRLDRFFYLYRNDVYLYRREGTKGFLYEAVRLSYHILRIVFKSDNKLLRIKQLVKGTWAGITFNPRIEMIQER